MLKPYSLFVLLAIYLFMTGCRKVELPPSEPDQPQTPIVVGKRVKEYRVTRGTFVQLVHLYNYDSLGRMVSRYEYTATPRPDNVNEKDTIIYQGSSILIQRMVYWDGKRAGGSGTDLIRYDRSQSGHIEKKLWQGAVIQDTTPFYPFGTKFYTWDTIRYFYSGTQFSQGLGHRYDSVFSYSTGMSPFYRTEERYDTLTQIEDAAGFLIKTVRRSTPYEANLPPNVFQSYLIEENYYTPLPDSARIELSNSILAKEFDLYPLLGFYPYPNISKVSRLDKWQTYQYRRNTLPPALPQLLTNYNLSFSFGSDSLLQSITQNMQPGQGASFIHSYFYQ